MESAPPTGTPGTHAHVSIRHAADEDLSFIVETLNREIAESPHVYAEQPLTLADRRQWLATHRAADLPVLVAEDGTRSLGWAALSPYRHASGYRFTAELSVYVVRSAHRRGIGAGLISALHAAARTRGLHAIVGSVDADNAASIALLARFGYVEAARLPEVGRKYDRWRTQLLLWRLLGDDGLTLT